MIDTKELRRKLRSDDLMDHVDIHANVKPVLTELLDRLEAAERKRDVLRDRLALESQENGALHEAVDRACEERDALRAKIAEMERREVGFRERCTPSTPTGYSNRFPLYALPGAQTQPAPSVPEVTDVMALAFHHALTDGSIGAREVEEIKDALRAALAAAPEAKPCP